MTGMPALEVKLRSMSEKRWDRVANKNLTEMFNRAARPPGTPIGKNTKRHIWTQDCPQRQTGWLCKWYEIPV